VPDRIPIDAIQIENTDAVGRLLGIPAGAVLDHLDIDGRIIAAGRYTGELPRRDGKELTPWGAEDDCDYGTAHFYPLAAASTVTDVERYAWPDPARYDFDAFAAELRNRIGDYALRGPYWVSGPLFSMACNVMGIEEALYKMLAEPAVFEACIEGVFRFSVGYVERFVQAAGDRLDILYLADDFATQRGLMMRPALWRRFLRPRYEQLFAIGKRLGLPVWFHSCGDISAVLPDLIEIGMDVWETVQLHTLPVTPAELKQTYGRDLAFFGGVNTQSLPFRNPAEVADEVRRSIEALAEGGGYICGPDHHVKPDVPAENVIALFDTARRYRRDGYTRSREDPVSGSFGNP
jgi:uroporphyrinogen decarboxylase